MKLADMADETATSRVLERVAVPSGVRFHRMAIGRGNVCHVVRYHRTDVTGNDVVDRLD